MVADVTLGKDRSIVGSLPSFTLVSPPMQYLIETSLKFTRISWNGVREQPTGPEYN